EQKRQTDEMDGFAGSPDLWDLGDPGADFASHGSLRDGGFSAEADLVMADLASDVGGPGGQAERCSGQHQNQQCIPAGKTQLPPELPQSEPGEGAGEFHEHQGFERGAFMSLNQRLRNPGPPADRSLSRAAG